MAVKFEGRRYLVDSCGLQKYSDSMVMSSRYLIYPYDLRKIFNNQVDT